MEDVRAVGRRWRPSPMQRDVVLTVLLTAVLLYGAVGEAHPSAANNATVDGQPVPQPPVIAYALVAIACLVLTWRRRWPVPTLAVSLGAVLIYTGLGYVYGAAVVAPMVGLYTVTSTARPRRAVLLGVGTFVSLGAASAFGPFGPFGGVMVVVAFETIAAVALGVAVANRRAYVAAIEDRAERAERTRGQEARRQVDAERLRIARELHDVVAHTISMINVQSRVAAQVIQDPPPQGAQALTAIKESSAEALRELRGILGLLRPTDDADPTEPAPGLDQLDALVGPTAGAGLPTTVTVTGTPYRLPPTIDLAAYRIVQESLTNALRYAGPATAAVSIRYATDGLLVQVDDTGCGAAESNGNGAGHGIIGMRERAAAVGGNLSVGNRTEGGFRVTARLPV